MKRIEFTLSMPGCPSWNGRWSGDGSAHTITRSVTDKKAKDLMGANSTASWFHSWTDGWRACVTARIMRQGERRPKSAGFCGYDWMVRNIIWYGDTTEPARNEGAQVLAAIDKAKGGAL